MRGMLIATLKQVMTWLTVALSAFSALSKGWLSFVLIPIAAVTLPVFVVLEYVATLGKRNAYRRSITATQIVLALAVVAYFSCTIGFLDDPNNAIVLDVFWVPAQSRLVQDLTAISTMSMYIAIAAAVLLIGLLVARHMQTPSA